MCQVPYSCRQPCCCSCCRAAPSAELFKWYSSLQYKNHCISHLWILLCIWSAASAHSSAISTRPEEGLPATGAVTCQVFLPLHPWRSAAEQVDLYAMKVCKKLLSMWFSPKLSWERKTTWKQKRQYFQLYILLRGYMFLKRLSVVLMLW